MNIDIETVNRQIDLESLATAAGSNLRRMGSELRGNCPLHGGKNKNGFAIYDNGRLWNCFTGDCGGGDALRFIMKLKGYTLPEAIKSVMGDTVLSEADLDRIRIEQAERAARELEAKIKQAQEVLASLQQSKIWLKYHTRLEADFDARLLWAEAGIPETYQDYWQLGYDPEHKIFTDNGASYTSPTMTIPIFDESWNCINVRHRILKPAEHWDKYRPERSGLPPNIFMADPDIKDPKGILLVEGEKKAMVTYITLDNPNYQVLGMAGKNVPYELIEAKIKDIEPVYLLFDPDAKVQAAKTAARIGERARIVDLPLKIDDLIIKSGVSKDTLNNFLLQSRRP